MMMTLAEFLALIQTETAVSFTQTLAIISENYHYEPTAFRNGNTKNAAGQNEGSCKIFAFAKLNNLTKNQTLACFGDYYRVDVLESPHASDHQNIRQFMEHGWNGIEFEQTNTLMAK
ncbi:MAG: hypothetical protein RLZZ66_1033 [Pseudomonadota bacterium]|jgi:hypothetical protein